MMEMIIRKMVRRRRGEHRIRMVMMKMMKGIKS